MKDIYVKTLIINLAVIIAAFVVFIFVDTKNIRAEENPDTCLEIEDMEIIEPKEYNFRDTPLYDWDASHYTDYNYINTNTNTRTIFLDSNKTKTADISFYSYRINYYRFEIAKFIFRGDINPKRAKVAVHRDGKIIPPFMSDPFLNLNKEEGEWTANWFFGYDTPSGEYRAVLYYDGYPVASAEFGYIKREPVKVNRAMSFVSLEANTPIYTRRAFNTKGERVEFTDALLDWMEYGDIEGFVNLSGQTTGWNNVSREKPWEYYCVRNLQEIGKEVHKAGGIVGAYIMCFYTPAGGWNKGGYEPAKAISFTSNGTFIRNSQFVSFRDKKRFNDIVELAKYFNKLPYVDMIGFDFIRFGEMAGLENVDDFVREMNVKTPSGWDKYSDYQKMMWMGQKIRDHTGSYRKRWNLWKAYRTASFIYNVRKEAKLTKPVWVYTLGWDKGWEHGQDPFMFTDAGVMMDKVMLYEASPTMFEGMARSWSQFLKDGGVNYVPGNQIDAVVNESIHGRNPVEEYYARLTRGSDFYPGGSQGVFIHDMLRAFWSHRRAGYSYYEWLLSGFSAVSHNRYAKGEIPFTLSIPRTTFPYTENDRTVSVPVNISFTDRKSVV